MGIKLLFLAGSSRKESLNKKLARHAASIAEKEDVTVTFIDLKDYDMPIYNGDLEAESGLPEKAKSLKKLFIEHDGIFIAAPEYNSSLAPLLKNSLDWISRKESEDEPALVAFKGKVAALSAASIGALGGLRGLVPLRMMLGNIGVYVTPSQAALSKATESFDENGKLVNEQQAAMVDKVVTELIEATAKLKK